MNLLLDTQILYWLFYEPEKLPPLARRALDHASTLYVSSASIWEMVIKTSVGKLTATPREIVRLMPEIGLEELPITQEHALAVGDLPPLHKDPFDRILMAQAVTEGLWLLTADEALRGYGKPVVLV